MNALFDKWAHDRFGAISIGNDKSRGEETHRPKKKGYFKKYVYN